MYYRIDPLWLGETCAILTCGPSTAQHNLRCLSKVRVIAINDAWKLWPRADVLFSGDYRFFNNNPDLSGYKGPMIACVSPESFDSIKDKRKVHIGRGPRRGITRDNTKVAGQFTCVGQAVNFAFHRGCRRIVLVGVDLCPSEEGRRYATSEEIAGKDVIETYSNMQRNLEYLGRVSERYRLGLRIAGQRSKLRGIRKFNTLEEALFSNLVVKSRRRKR